MEGFLYVDGVSRPPPSGRQRTMYLPPEEEETLMRSLARQTGGAIEGLFNIIDTPGAIARGVIAGDPYSGFSFDSDRRVSGKEMNEALGLKYDNPYMGTAAGLFSEIVTDPLLLLTGPTKALTPAGRAASSAGLLDLAPVAAMRRMGGYDEAAKTLTGRYTNEAFKQVLPEIAQKTGQRAAAAVPEALSVRPLLGPRLSRATATLDDVVKSSGDEAGAMAKLQDFLDANKLKYDDIKDQPLGGLVGFGYGDPSSVYLPNWAPPVLDVMDWAGQRLAWSAPARYASAWFDKRMKGQAGVGDQIDMLRLASREADETERGRRLAARYLTPFTEINDSSRPLLGGEGLTGVEGGRALTRLFEDVATGADDAIVRQVPGLKRAVQNYDAIRKSQVAEAARLGMDINEYKDKFGVLYSPRYAAEVELGEQAGGLGKALFNTASPEGNARVWYLKTPGGTDELRQISTLPIVVEHATKRGDSPYSNEQVGQAIAEWLEAKHGKQVISDRQGTLIANFMQHRKKDLPDSYPIFAEHPLNAQARAMVSHRRNVARTKFAFDKLAESAIQARSQSIQGGGWRSLDSSVLDVAKTIGLRLDEDGLTAIRNQIAQRLAKRYPNLDPATIDFTQMSIPQSVYDRLTRVQQVFNSPKAWKDVWSLFEKFTTVFKGFVLAWPSRHVRDAYSNAFSVWLETGNASDTLSGMTAASKILAGEYAEAMPFLKQLPRYARLADETAVRRQLAEDVGGTGVLSTLASSDLLSARQSAAITEIIPGFTPVRMSDAIQELVPDGTRTGSEMIKDFFTIQGVNSDWHTKNPLLNASQKINDANDSIARLGGFLALMKQGITPDQAAERITTALVDYSSLTDIEKSVFKVIFPWWTYSSRTGKYVIQQLLAKPGGRYGQTVRALNTLQHSNEEDPYIPTALRQQFAVRVPDELLPMIGRKPGGETTTYLKDIDIPGVDVLSLFAPGRGGLDVSETAQNIAQQTHPLLRTAAEMGTGLDLFSKRPLEEAVTPLDRIYQSLFGTKTRLNPTAKAIIQNIPGLQRPISLFGGLSDQRIPMSERVLKQAINNLTGVKLQDVDPDWLYSDIDRKISQNLKGYISRKNIDFIPEDLMPEVPQDLQRQYLLKKSVERKNREYKAKKRAAKEFAK